MAVVPTNNSIGIVKNAACLPLLELCGTIRAIVGIDRAPLRGEAITTDERLRQRDVFLSHNSTDKPDVEHLARRLVREGLDPWMDIWHLIPGTPWQPAIEEALANSSSCAVFIGRAGFGPWQHEEMRAAIDRRVAEVTPKRGDTNTNRYRVIPVLLPGAERPERSR